MSLVKSKQRVADHGEVFTPVWMVEAMLDLVKDETERIDSRFLEPACGSGNFIMQILRRKLAAVELKYGKSDFERRHYALLALMCIYGIELLADNIAECFVPTQAWDKKWTDDVLYAKYGISPSEIEFIEKVVRPMDLSRDLLGDVTVDEADDE